SGYRNPCRRAARSRRWVRHPAYATSAAAELTRFWHRTGPDRDTADQEWEESRVRLLDPAPLGAPCDSCLSCRDRDEPCVRGHGISWLEWAAIANHMEIVRPRRPRGSPGKGGARNQRDRRNNMSQRMRGTRNASLPPLHAAVPASYTEPHGSSYER